MKYLPILILLVAFSAFAQAPVVLQPGQSAICGSPLPTATATPVATPTPVIDPNAITGITNCPPTIALNNPPSVRYPAWTVDSNVASVNVTDNGVAIPNPNPLVGSPTALYRVGGVPTGLCSTCGYFIITYIGGTHTLVWTALNDAGQVINVTTKVVQVQ